MLVEGMQSWVRLWKHFVPQTVHPPNSAHNVNYSYLEFGQFESAVSSPSLRIFIMQNPAIPCVLAEADGGLTQAKADGSTQLAQKGKHGCGSGKATTYQICNLVNAHNNASGRLRLTSRSLPSSTSPLSDRVPASTSSSLYLIKHICLLCHQDLFKPKSRCSKSFAGMSLAFSVFFRETPDLLSHPTSTLV